MSGPSSFGITVELVEGALMPPTGLAAKFPTLFEVKSDFGVYVFRPYIYCGSGSKLKVQERKYDSWNGFLGVRFGIGVDMLIFFVLSVFSGTGSIPGRTKFFPLISLMDWSVFCSEDSDCEVLGKSVVGLLVDC